MPRVATLGSVAVSGSDVTLSGLAAEGAVGFDVELRPLGGEFTGQASGVAGPDFSILALAAGGYETRVAGRNAAGLGPWSEPAGFTV